MLKDFAQYMTRCRCQFIDIGCLGDIFIGDVILDRQEAKMRGILENHLRQYLMGGWIAVVHDHDGPLSRCSQTQEHFTRVRLR